MSAPASAGQHSIREYITSDTIALEGVDSHTSFNVHEGLISSISPAISAACKSEWQEGTLRRYKFREDVTEQVLLCFLTWAYRGDYDSTSGDDVISPSVRPMVEIRELDNAQKDTKDTKARTLFKSRESAADELAVEYEHEADGNAYEVSSKSVPFKNRIAHPLLLHAKLYVFAHMYLIQPLKVSAKQKVIDQLLKFDTLYEGNERAAVFDALDYTFSRLPEEDLFIHWLARYASWKLEVLKQMPARFDDLLSGDESVFARSLVRYVSQSNINPFSLTEEQIRPRYPM